VRVAVIGLRNLVPVGSILDVVGGGRSVRKVLKGTLSRDCLVGFLLVFCVF
jgi:hypothetical protein